MSTSAVTLDDFVADLSRRGIHLWAEGEALRYRAPANALTAELREELGSRKHELLDLLRRHGEPAADLRLEADPARLYEPFPLTDIQQAYWIGTTSAFELGNVSAHLYMEREVRDLDLGRFERAWRRLIERHDMLRAVVTDDGQLRILPVVPPYPIEVLDLRGQDPAAVEARLAGIRKRMSEEGPALDRWPLFELRATLRDGGVTDLHLGLSLLICDAMSSQTLFRELLQLYAEPDRPLPPLEISFRDYAVTLGEIQRSEAYQRSLDYWRSRLDSLPAAPELPLAKSPGSLPASRFTVRSGSLEPELWRRLKERVSRAGLTPTAVVAEAYSEVLGVWSKEPRFLLNVLFFNRPPLHPQIHQVVGNFSATILLEVDLTRAATFEERTRRLQEQLWRDIEHARVSGVRVLREMNQRQGGGARSAIPVVLASTLNLAQSGGAISVDREDGRNFDRLQTPHVWIDQQAAERDGALVFHWEAVEELFPPGLLDAMFVAYQGLLRRLATEDAVWREDDLGLLPADQSARRLAANDTAGPLSDDLLHSGFLRQAALDPSRPAVIAPGRTLTYGELRRRSLRLAHALRRLGCRPNRLVAIVMEKGWEQIVAALAILESGAAYLPIDAALPRERRWYLLDHGEVEVVLVQEKLDRDEEWPPGVQRLVVGEDESDADDPEPLPCVQGPSDLAYVIYTSGSTGLPKGVMIDHRGAVNTVLDVNSRFGVGLEDRVLALSSMSFDLSVYDVFGLLGVGGAVVLPASSAGTEPAHWREMVERHRVTLWNSVPALVVMLVDHTEGRNEPLPVSLRVIMMSGDWIPLSLPGRIRALHPEVRVISMGGATEASIWSILYPIGEVDPAWTSILYGKPLVNQAFHVLDELLLDCPEWVTGNLYIEGVGLALGYWRDEVKTRASFRIHPRTGLRIYRTGDLGRYLPDGNLEILGREDFQVKVQGYRIELGEIEATLLQHPDVQSAVVTAVGEARGSKRLVAYVIPVPGRAPSPEELHRFLEGKLPAYMVPAAVMLLEQLPLTSNGKVDRASLAALSTAAADHRGDFVPPRDELEMQLTQIWRELLDQPTLGVRDNFFDFGGHSLLAVRLMTRIRQRIGRDLPLAALFEAPTVERLAAALRDQGGTLHRSPLVTIQPAGSAPPFFCVHPVGGNVLCYFELARHLGTDRPFLGLQVPGTREPLASDPSLPEMAAGYVAALRERQPQGPYVLGGWSLGGVVAYEMARQLTEQGEIVARLVLMDAERPRPELSARIDDARLMSWFARDLGGLVGRELEIDPELLRPRDLEGRLGYVLERAREAHLPQEVGPDQMRRLWEVFRQNFRAMLDFDPPAWPGALHLLRVEEPAGDDPDDPTLGWGEVALGGVDVQIVPGDHYTMVQPPQVEELARRLRLCLA